jgi:hypothetical protein
MAVGVSVTVAVGVMVAVGVRVGEGVNTSAVAFRAAAVWAMAVGKTSDGIGVGYEGPFAAHPLKVQREASRRKCLRNFISR